MNPRRKASLEIQHVANEVLVNDPETGKVHVLNATAGDILERCDGTHSIEELVRTLVERTGVDADLIDTDVRAIVAAFDDLKLFEKTQINSKRSESRNS